MQKYKNMLIVLEGLDGAGKSTQVKMIKEYLIDGGLDLEYLHFPRFNSPVYGNLIAKFLRGDFGANDVVHPQLVALLYAEDRRLAATDIRSWLAEGKVVLLDRYVYSNIAFQCAKLPNKADAKELRDWIFDTEYNQFRIPKPNLNLFLDVPLDFVSDRLEENRSGDERDYLNGKEDIHESDMGFQLRVRDIYIEQTKEDAEFLRIDCSDENGYMLKTESIFNKIKKEVENIL